MAFYRTCPFCSSNLDPGERCDCQVSHQPGWDEVAATPPVKYLKQSTKQSILRSNNIELIASRQHFSRTRERNKPKPLLPV